MLGPPCSIPSPVVLTTRVRRAGIGVEPLKFLMLAFDDKGYNAWGSNDETQEGIGMGSPAKARAFMEASEAGRLYAGVVDYALRYFIARAEKEGNASFAADLRQASESYAEDFEKALRITEEVYCEIFSDDELDELIVMHSTTPIRKLRGLMPDIMGRVLEKYAHLDD